MMSGKPLFIPLKTEFYEAFYSGSKDKSVDCLHGDQLSLRVDDKHDGEFEIRLIDSDDGFWDVNLHTFDGNGDYEDGVGLNLVELRTRDEVKSFCRALGVVLERKTGVDDE